MATLSLPSVHDEEVKLEMRSTAPVPDTRHNYSVNFVWKSTSFDRMQNAMKMFAVSWVQYVFLSLCLSLFILRIYMFKNVCKVREHNFKYFVCVLYVCCYVALDINGPTNVVVTVADNIVYETPYIIVVCIVMCAGE